MSSLGEDLSDYLFIYDGATTSAPLIGVFSGNDLPPVITSTSPEGKLTFRFISPTDENLSNWEARVTCVVPTVPDRPEAPVLGSVLSHTIFLSWTPPHHNGSSITNYVLEQKEGGSGEFSTIYQGPDPAYASSGLREGTEYFYRVQAVNGIGPSEFSEEAGIVAAASRLVLFEGETTGACGAAFFDPGDDANYDADGGITMTIAPSSDVEKVQVTFTSFELSRLSSLGEDLSDYLFIYDGATTSAPRIGVFSGNDLPPVITSTSPDGKLTFRFISPSDGNLSNWEARVTCVVPAVPDRPEAPVFGSVLSHIIFLSWTPPPHNGSPITNYVLEQKEGGSGEFSIIYQGPDPAYASSGLREGTEYFYRVQAVNGIGSSAFSEEAGIVLASRLVMFEGETTGACGATFFDPGHDGDYDNGEDMTMTIAPSSGMERVQVTFTSFDVESTFDLLSIHNGTTTGAPLIGAFSGNELPPVITSTGPEGKLTFYFTSDEVTVRPGWEALVDCVPRATIFEQADYRFPVAPGAPPNTLAGLVRAVAADVAHNAGLSYSIHSQTLNGSAVSAFAVSDVAEGGVVLGAIRVKEGATLAEGQRYELVVRVSEGGGGSADANVVIEVTSSVAMFNEEMIGCGLTFLDPGGGGDYDNDLDIIQTIAPSSDMERVQVTFTSFDVESRFFDVLSIHDGTAIDASLIGDFSGNDLPPVITSTGPEGKLTFRFTSNDSNVRSGWEAQVTCVPRVPDDDDPDITIAAGPSPVEEGEKASFTLTRTGRNLSAALTVNVAVDDGAGHFLPSTGVPTMGIFMENMSTASLAIPTHDDDVDEADGTLTATVIGGDGYRAGSPSEATAIVTDNDDPGPLGVFVVESAQPYPNPSGDVLHIRTASSGPLTVTVHFLSGKRLLQRSLKTVKNVASLNVSSLRNGVYLVQVTDSEGTSERYRLLKRE